MESVSTTNSCSSHSSVLECCFCVPKRTQINYGFLFTTGARNLRDAVLNAFTTAYKLKTMQFGAIVREWPNGFSVWNEDANEPDGYRVLETYARDPPREMTNELYDVRTYLYTNLHSPFEISLLSIKLLHSNFTCYHHFKLYLPFLHYSLFTHHIPLYKFYLPHLSGGKPRP
jgi:Domain of unknown function (DUF1995)